MLCVASLGLVGCLYLDSWVAKVNANQVGVKVPANATANDHRMIVRSPNMVFASETLLEVAKSPDPAEIGSKVIHVVYVRNQYHTRVLPLEMYLVQV